MPRLSNIRRHVADDGRASSGQDSPWGAAQACIAVRGAMRAVAAVAAAATAEHAQSGAAPGGAGGVGVRGGAAGAIRAACAGGRVRRCVFSALHRPPSGKPQSIIGLTRLPRGADRSDGLLRGYLLLLTKPSELSRLHQVRAGQSHTVRDLHLLSAPAIHAAGTR